MAQQTDQRLRVVLGIGVTGLAVARFLAERGEPFAVCDTRDRPPLLDDFCAEFPTVECHLGARAGQALAAAGELVASPGLAPTDPLLVAARRQRIPVVGDIELFARCAQAPVVAITGSNGKSTVTELLGEMARAATRNTAVGGNLGTPALELLDDDCELYVLELSSFQLEITESLKPAVACILNLSQDHQDRYDSMAHYLAAKQRIFSGARHIVFNRDDRATRPTVSGAGLSSFGLDGDFDGAGFGLKTVAGERCLAAASGDLFPARELRIKGRHNRANALAALAMGSAIGLPWSAMTAALRNFAGLAHRCQTVRELHGVSYINDSKATNPGAALAALEGLGEQNNILWIAGGESKGAEFDELLPAVERAVKRALLIGVDGGRIGEKVSAHAAVEYCQSMAQAVAQAQQAARPGDLVLLSPACASFDMFGDFKARGDAFVAAVEALQ